MPRWAGWLLCQGSVEKRKRAERLDLIAKKEEARKFEVYGRRGAAEMYYLGRLGLLQRLTHEHSMRDWLRGSSARDL